MLPYVRPASSWLLASLILLSFVVMAGKEVAQEPQPRVPQKYVGKWVGEAGKGEALTREETGAAVVITDFGHTVERFEFTVDAQGAVTGSGMATYRYKAMSAANALAANSAAASELVGQTQRMEFQIAGTMSRHGKLQLKATPARELALINASERTTMPAWDVLGGLVVQVDAEGDRLVADAFGVTVVNGKTTKIAWRAKAQGTVPFDGNGKLPAPGPQGQIPKVYVGWWKGSGRELSKRQTKIGRTDALVDMGALIDQFEIEVADTGKVKGTGKATYWFDVSSDAKIMMAARAPYSHLAGNTEQVDFDITGTMSAEGKLKLIAAPKRDLTLINGGNRSAMGSWNVFGGIEGTVQPGGQELAVKATGTVDALKMKIDWKARKPAYQVVVEIKGVVKKNGVDVPTNYEDWLPQAGNDELRPANYVSVHAHLLTWDGRAVQDGIVKKFTFELLDVSTEPGVCLNHPPHDKAKDNPDLQFDQARNNAEGVNVLSPSKAEKQGALTEAKAFVSSYDWGAYGSVKVTAELEDNQGKIVGVLKDPPHSEKILLPKRQPNSVIADKWKADNQVQANTVDKDDVDEKPKGDGGVGDGFTLYEEYRGFYASADPPDPAQASGPQDHHLRTDPHKKDLFVLDEANLWEIQKGMLLFQRITELAVHQLGTDEMYPVKDQKKFAPMFNVVNFNHKTAHRDDRPGVPGQHGVRIVVPTDDNNGEQDLGGASGAAVPVDKSTADSRHGTPKKFKHVVLDPSTRTMVVNWGMFYNEPTNLENYLAALVAHELCHTVGVWHHGEATGFYELWWRREDGTLRAMPVSDEKARRISGMSSRSLESLLSISDGHDLTVWKWDGRTQYPPTHSKFNTPWLVYVSTLHSDHSGSHECVMTYDRANAFASKEGDGSFSAEQNQWKINNPHTLMRRIRFLWRPNFAQDLCTGISGDSLYGTADPAPMTSQGAPLGPSPRGNCKGQIRVNDYDNAALRGH